MKRCIVAGVQRSCDGSAASIWIRTAAIAVAGLVAGGDSAFAQDAAEINPAPAAIGADVPATYFGPQPSSVQRELIGEYQNLKSGKVDLQNGTITLPL
jgi:hypothetical protein